MGVVSASALISTKESLAGGGVFAGPRRGAISIGCGVEDSKDRASGMEGGVLGVSSAMWAALVAGEDVGGVVTLGLGVIAADLAVF